MIHWQCTAAYLLVVVAADEDHRNHDCFAVVVLTHGGDDGILCGTDSTITVDHLLQPIKDCTSLAGKPKLCIFQVGCVSIL